MGKIPGKEDLGFSLVVQWLRLHTPNAGGLGSIPGQGTRPHMVQLDPEQPETERKEGRKDLWATRDLH